MSILSNVKKIGTIGNREGDLTITHDGEKYYWSIDDWQGYEWEEIPKYLYDALLKYETERDKSND